MSKAMSRSRSSAAVLVVSLLVVGDVTVVNGLDNGFLKPPMGFNPWNCFGYGHTGHPKLNVPWAHRFNDSVIRKVALAMNENGLQKAGYNYVNLDCGWTTGYRDAQGKQIVNTTRYPHGMKNLGDYIHSLGMKYGIYSSASKAQCCSRFYHNSNDGSLGFEEVDAQSYADFGVDYLKYDGCGSTQSSYPRMVDGLNKTGRHIFLSVNGVTPSSAAASVSNIWRTTGDDDVDFINKLMVDIFAQDQFADLAGPGHFNDPDMLEVGNYPITTTESRSHFSLWCAVKAPLIIGTDVTNITAEVLEILVNSEAIAVNQDSLGIQAKVVWKSEKNETPSTPKPRAVVPQQSVIAGPLENGCVTVVLFNAAMETANITVTSAILKPTIANLATSYTMRDLWKHEDIGTFSDSFTSTVPSHDVVFLKLTPTSASN